VGAVVVAETMVDRVAAAATAAVEAHTAGLAGANLDPRGSRTTQRHPNGVPFVVVFESSDALTIPP
jgi:hypothetical protein